jgi:hypothetical protein
MPKTSYSVYSIGSPVYGISRHYKDHKPTDQVAIYEAIVDGASIDYDKNTNTNKITYMLKTPNGEEWGDSVDEKEVSDDFDELTHRIKEEWSKNSNSFGD